MVTFVVLPTCTETSPPARSSTPPSTAAVHAPSSSGCPPVDVVEELHAAAFYFEHGPAPSGKEHLRRAQSALSGPTDAATLRVLEMLARVSAEIETDPDGHKSATEDMRVLFADWACLPDSVHRRFHTALPPIP